MRLRASSQSQWQSSARPSAPIGPPLGVLLAAGSTAAVAWALLPFHAQPLRLLGWALGSLLTIGLVTAYTAFDAKRSQSTLYAAKPSLARMRSLVALAGVVAAVLHTFAFATKVAS